MATIEGEGEKDRWSVPGIGIGRWFIVDSSEGKIAVNLPRGAIGKSVSRIKIKIEWEE